MDNTRTALGDERHYSKTLYQKGARGETRVWSIWVTGSDGKTNEGGEATIHREHGTLGGKHTGTTRVIHKGKNLGKKNETTPLEQAIAEAKSVATKKAREGYSPEEATRGEVSHDVVLPMLAHDYHKQSRGLSFPCYAQPKLDGVRMVAERLADGSIRMTTRTGKVVSFLNHIREALHKILPVGVVLDGELFTTDRTFEEITGIVRRSVKDQRDLDESEQICYHIFDAFHRGQEAMSYVKRKTLVHDTLRDITAESPLVIVPTVDIGSQEDADETHVTFVAEGHEGTIYRTPEAPYKIRLRSRDLLKRKDFITDEYRIVGATQGVGKDDGSVIWVVETSPAASGAGDAPGVDPQRFNVRPRGSLEQRRRWWDDRDSYVDKMITVRFQNLTEGGIPRFPVGLTVRDYE